MCSPVHFYSEVRPVEFSGTNSQTIGYRIAALERLLKRTLTTFIGGEIRILFSPVIALISDQRTVLFPG